MHFESSSNIEGCNCTPCTPLTADLYLISLHRVCNNLATNVGTQEFGYSLQIYQCHLCAVVFERKCKLENHVKRVHNEKWVPVVYSAYGCLKISLTYNSNYIQCSHQHLSTVVNM